MLLTDRFLSSHRLEWLCLFLGCGLGQRLVLNARCLTAGETHSVQDAGVASRGRCSLNGVIGVFPLDQRENLMTCHLILLKFTVISMMSTQFGLIMVLNKLQQELRVRMACSHTGDASSKFQFTLFEQHLDAKCVKHIYNNNINNYHHNNPNHPSTIMIYITLISYVIEFVK